MKIFRSFSKYDLNNYNPKLIALATLLTLHIFYSLFFSPTGLLSIDEGTYHQMTRSFTQTGTLELWNGYQEFPSSELTLWNSRVYDGHLMPQYPYLYPVLAAPFYLALGFKGLFLLNSICFIGIIVLCFALARKLFDDTNLALNSCLILFLATYFWEYSQGAWSHAVAILFTTGSLYLAILGFLEGKPRKATAMAMASGLVAGLGIGVRLDSIFIVPALLAPFLIEGQRRTKKFAAFFLGLIPGLAVLSITNYLKFGVFSPFSYGRSANAPKLSPESYLPIIAVGAAAVLGIWLLARLPRRFLSGKGKVALGALVVTVACLGFPPLRQTASRWINGIYQLVVDLRIRDLDIREGALSRTSDGAVVYYGLALKKSLLQSCPYLTVLFLPLAKIARAGKKSVPLAVLYIPLFVFIAVFSYFAWHGGPGFNMRYFLPILPFTSILCAYAWQDLTRDLGRAWHLAWLMVAALVFAGASLLQLAPDASLEFEESAYLTFPLLLALVLLILTVYFCWLKKPPSPLLQGGISVVLVMALVWSGVVAFAYDYSRGYLVRTTFASIAKTTAEAIEPDSILFVDYPEPFFGVEKERLRLAIPGLDKFEDFRPLLDFHLHAGRSAYLFFEDKLMRQVQNKELLDGLYIVSMQKNQFGTLYKVAKPSKTTLLSDKLEP